MFVSSLYLFLPGQQAGLVHVHWLERGSRFGWSGGEALAMGLLDGVSITIGLEGKVLPDFMSMTKKHKIYWNKFAPSIQGFLDSFGSLLWNSNQKTIKNRRAYTNWIIHYLILCPRILDQTDPQDGRCQPASLDTSGEKGVHNISLAVRCMLQAFLYIYMILFTLHKNLRCL